MAEHATASRDRISNLETHARWKFTEFRLVARKDNRGGETWIKVFFQIEIQGKTDGGTDEFTVKKSGDAWVVMGVPT